MTNLTNYHSHCLYCDGRANMDDFIRFAISEGFTSYGISSHAPLSFSTAWTMEWDRMEDYLSEFSRLKKKYAGKIELAIGLEIDYLNEENNPSLPCFQKLPLDYRIGSVHMLYSPEGKIVDIDTPADLFRQLVDRHFDGDLDSVVHLYPNERYFPFLKELGIRVQVNSDAHYPERINNARFEGLAALKKAGFTSVVEWHGGKWEDIPIG